MTESQILPSLLELSANGFTPTVSIGMPIYNDAKYIRESLDSLLAQTYTNFELIISDNASTDNTSIICQEYVKKDQRIRYILQPHNLGAVFNFQFVLSEAQGKYFMWAACDDRWTSNFLECTTSRLENNENCSLAFSNYIEKNLENNKEKKHQVLSSNSKSPTFNYIIRTLNMRPSLIYGLHRKKNIQDIKLQSFDFSDLHLISELAIKTRIQVIDDYLYISGTKGLRKPYSITHKKINRTIFLHEQYKLLDRKFHAPTNKLLFLLVCLVMLYNKIKLWRY